MRNRLVTLLVLGTSLALPALAWAGGGGGAAPGGGGVVGAPEPAFWLMAAVVAGGEIGRRVLRK